MAAPRLKGNVGVRQVHFSRRRTVTSGWTTTIKYRGLLADILLAQDNDFYTLGAVDSFVTQNGDTEPDAILTVTFSARSQQDAILPQPSVVEFANTWEWVPNREQIPVEAVPKFRDLAEVDVGFIERIKQSVDNYKSRVASGISNQDSDKDLLFVLTDYIDLSGIGASAEQITAASELSNHLLAGKDTVNRDRATLRNIRVVPGNTTLVTDHYQVNKMWANDKLVGLIHSTPVSITQRTIIGDLTQWFSGTYWFKSRPDANELSNGRWEIVTEYVNYEDKEFETTVNEIYS